MKWTRLAWCCGLLLAASTVFAQMYTVTDLGAFNGSWSEATAINASGQVAGNTLAPQPPGEFPVYHAFRTAPNRAMNSATDDVANTYCDLHNVTTTCVAGVWANGINNSGQVVGQVYNLYGQDRFAFATAANSPVQTYTDWFPTNSTAATGINASGQVLVDYDVYQSFLTTASAPGDSFRDYKQQSIGTLSPGGIGTFTGYTEAYGINDVGQAVGRSDTGAAAPNSLTFHAFRTRPNKAIRPGTDDLGTLGGTVSYGYGVNLFGQVVGTATIAGDTASHAFRTAPNRKINAAKDDLGTLGGSYSAATSLNNFGETVGWSSLSGDAVQHAFIYGRGGMQDLNNLVAASADCELIGATRNSPVINDSGQIAANRTCNGQQHAVLMTPIYKALVQPPVKADGSSVFAVKQAVLLLRFQLQEQGTPTCTLPPATVAIRRASQQILSVVSEETIYGDAVSSAAPNGVAPILCQYVDPVQPSRLGAGTYLVDLSIHGIMVGHAVFTLR
jgi:probable HAF family extracellular repeat protein